MNECPICGGATDEQVVERVFRIGKRKAVVPHRLHICDECGEEYLDPGEMEAVRLRASNAIRRREDLLLPDQIVGVREKYGLTQRDLECLLGAGAKTAVRWERGFVFQNSATDRLIRVIGEFPQVVEYLSRLPQVEAEVPGLSLKVYLNLAEQNLGPHLDFMTQDPVLRSLGVRRSQPVHQLPELLQGAA